ncbi:DUF1348 family protein [Limobrevibacterium gyesilva]
MTRWQRRAEFFQAHTAIIEFLKRKRAKEVGYQLIKGPWV